MGEPWRRFTLALAAPYVRVEQTRGSQAPTEGDEVWFGYCSPGAEPGLRRVRTALRRDWGVRNRPTAQDALAVLDDRSRGHLLELVADRRILVRDLIDHLDHLEVPGVAIERVVAALGPRASDPPTIPAPDPALIAFDVARGANLVRWSAGVPFVSLLRAEESMDLLGVTALIAFHGWPEFAEHYAVGLRRARAPRAEAFVEATRWLQHDPASPWTRQAWASAGRPGSAPVVPGPRLSGDQGFAARSGAESWRRA